MVRAWVRKVGREVWRGSRGVVDDVVLVGVGMDEGGWKVEDKVW